MKRPERLFSVALLASCAAAACAQGAPAGGARAQGATPDAKTTFASTEVTGGTRFFSLEHRSQSLINEADAQILEQRRAEIAQEAEFYLFNLGAGIWTYEQVMCPEMPGQILMQYSSLQEDGRQSRFNAMVPRQGGRVRIVPVLYRGASPFGDPVSNPRNMRLFNAVVPADVARQSADENGHWLSLAACYVELTAAHSHIATEPSLSIDLIRAPDPTLIVQPSYSQVVFADRAEREKFVVWSVTLSKEGRVTAAGMDRRDITRGKIVPMEQPVAMKEVPAEGTLKTTKVPDSAPMKTVPVPEAPSASTPPQDAPAAPNPQPNTTAGLGRSSAPSADASETPAIDLAPIPADRKVKVVEHPGDPQPVVKRQPTDPQGRVVRPANSQPNPQNR